MNVSSPYSETPTETTAGRGPSFIPSLSLLKPAPATYSVNPATFTHNIFNALWFIGIFEFISGLHDAGILPVWFFIP